MQFSDKAILCLALCMGSVSAVGTGPTVYKKIFSDLTAEIQHIDEAMAAFNGKNMDIMDTAFDNYFETLESKTKELESAPKLNEETLASIGGATIEFTSKVQHLVTESYQKKRPIVAENSLCKQFAAMAAKTVTTKDKFVAVFRTKVPEGLWPAVENRKLLWDELATTLQQTWSAENCTQASN